MQAGFRMRHDLQAFVTSPSAMVGFAETLTPLEVEIKDMSDGEAVDATHLLHRCRMNAMILHAPAAALAIWDSSNPDNMTFQYLQTNREDEIQALWELRASVYAQFLTAVAGIAFPNKFLATIPSYDLGMQSAVKFNFRASKLKKGRRSYSKRHCDCQAKLTVKFISSEEEAKACSWSCGNKLFETFKELKTGWYVVGVHGVHMGCFGTYDIPLSEDEERMIGEMLLKHRYASIALPQSITLVKSNLDVQLSSNQA